METGLVFTPEMVMREEPLQAEDYIANEKIKNVANKVLYASAVVIPLITIILISRL